MRCWLPLLILLALSPFVELFGQAGFVYYDVDRLYDTIPSPFYNDDRYTPEGRYRWNATRYRAKVEGVAALVDSLAQPLVALYGIENESVARDLSAATKGDYTFLHRTLNAFDGMEFALLYHADRFQPLGTRTARNTLIVDGLLDRDTVTLLLTADGRFLNDLVTEARQRHPQRPCIVAGRLGNYEAADYGLRDPFAAAASRGHGTRQQNGRWQMRDRIWVDPRLHADEGQVYIREFLLDASRATPLPTYSGNRYRGGRSRHLPIWCRIGR